MVIILESAKWLIGISYCFLSILLITPNSDESKFEQTAIGESHIAFYRCVVDMYSVFFKDTDISKYNRPALFFVRFNQSDQHFNLPLFVQFIN